jgi:hypothetical protein
VRLAHGGAMVGTMALSDLVLASIMVLSFVIFLRQNGRGDMTLSYPNVR